MVTKKDGGVWAYVMGGILCSRREVERLMGSSTIEPVRLISRLILSGKPEAFT